MIISTFVVSVTVTLVYVSLILASGAARVEGSRLKRYVPIIDLAVVFMGLLPVFIVIYSYFTGPQSPLAQARPYLTVAAIVGLAALIGKFALSAAIVPFLKAIPGAVAGIVVKTGWDKWHARKPREPKPQG